MVQPQSPPGQAQPNSLACLPSILTLMSVPCASLSSPSLSVYLIVNITFSFVVVGSEHCPPLLHRRSRVPSGVPAEQAAAGLWGVDHSWQAVRLPAKVAAPVEPPPAH